MMKLTTHFLGFDMENPWCLASAPPTATGEMIARAFDAGWAAAVIKTVPPEAEPIINVAPRIQTMKRWNRNIAMQNIELITDRKLSVWLEELKILRKRYPEKMLIASIMAPGNDMSAWAQLVEAMNKVGCNAIELNLGCPHGMPERNMGSICSQDPDITFNIVQTAKAVSKIPIMVKLTPNVTNIKTIATAAKRAGVDAITVINTVNGIIGVDIYKKEPLLSVNGQTTIGGISGMAVKPIGLKCVAECKQATNLPIAAAGGIAQWNDGVEYLLMGAQQLQLCTEVMLRGYKIIKGLNQGLVTYMEKMGHTKIDQIIGNLHSQVTTFNSLLERSSTNKVKINEASCIGCNLCIVSCDDAGYQALRLKKSPAVAEVIEKNCTGCNLCITVCPIENCMTLYDSGKPFPYTLDASYSEVTL